VTASSIDRPPSLELLTVDLTVVAPVARITAVGEVDSSSAGILRERLDAALDAAGHGDVHEIVVDLVPVTFLDSAGLCVLAGAHRRATERGLALRVLASARAVVRPLQITGLWDLLGAQQPDSAGAPLS
jgi:anti-sigma B factor antagonist